MQTFVVAPADHHAPGELIDDDDFALAHDVVLVAHVDGVGGERLFEVMGHFDVTLVVDAFAGRDARQLLDPVDSLLGEGGVAVLDVDLVVPVLAELPDDLGELVVAVGGVARRSGDDERGPGFVDQDVVDLVDDGVVEWALDQFFRFHHHVVAEVVEAEFVVGGVGDVRFVRLAAADGPQVGHALVFADVIGVVEIRRIVLDAADREPQVIVDLAHPLGVALDEVIVDGDDVDAPAGQGVQGHGQGGCLRLAFAGLHFGDLALVQGHAADDLDIEVPLADGSPGCFAGGREHLGEVVVEVGLLLVRLPELDHELPELGLRECLEFRFERVDFVDNGVHAANFFVVGIAQEAVEE